MSYWRHRYGYWHWRHERAMAWHRGQVAMLWVMLILGAFICLQYVTVWTWIASNSSPKVAFLSLLAYPMVQVLFSLSYISRSFHIWTSGWLLMLGNLALDIWIWKITLPLLSR